MAKGRSSSAKGARAAAASVAKKPSKTVTKATKTQPAKPKVPAAKAAKKPEKRSGTSDASGLSEEVRRFLLTYEDEMNDVVWVATTSDPFGPDKLVRRPPPKKGVAGLSQKLVNVDFMRGAPLEYVKSLLQQGAGANYKGAVKPDQYGIVWEAATPMHAAVQTRSAELVKLLASHGGDVNASVDGGTPLQAAALQDVVFNHGELSETIAALVDLGADVKVLDKDGDTLMHLAVRASHFIAAFMFKELGLDATQKNKKGDDIFSLAMGTKKGIEKALAEMEAEKDPEEDWREAEYGISEAEQRLRKRLDDVRAALPLLQIMVDRK